MNYGDIWDHRLDALLLFCPLFTQVQRSRLTYEEPVWMFVFRLAVRVPNVHQIREGLHFDEFPV